MTLVSATVGLVLGSLAAWTHGHAGEASGDRPTFQVSAIVIREDGVSWALMAEPQLTQGTMRMVAQGGMIGPYRLVEVASDHVVMQGPSGGPFRVPFSWRGVEAGPSPAGRAMPESEKDARARAQTNAADEVRRERRSPRAPRERSSSSADSPPGHGPSLSELSHGLPPEAQAQVEEFMRRREQLLREELGDTKSTPRK